jgi:hypothetical protein
MRADTSLIVPSVAVDLLSWVGRPSRSRFLVGATGLALLVAGLASQWHWLVAVGIAPLLLSAVPCVAMCALGVCVHRMGRFASSKAHDEPTVQTISQHASISEEK